MPAEATAIRVFIASNPAANVNTHSRPLDHPPTPADKTNRPSWVGVSAPMPCMIPTLYAARGPGAALSGSGSEVAGVATSDLSHLPARRINSKRVAGRALNPPRDIALRT